MRGNRSSNAVFEAHIPLGSMRPSCSDPLGLCADWIQAKYVRREFVKPREQPDTLHNYSITPRKVTLWKGSRSKVTQARIIGGVVFIETSGWAPCCFFVALNSTLQVVSKRASPSAPQDRPVDSRDLQVLDGKGVAVLEIEVGTNAEAVVWLKALRGSTILGERSGTRAGWLTTLAGTLRRKRRRWFVLHPSGLHKFKTDAIGAELPECSTSTDWKDVIHPSWVLSIEFGGSDDEADSPMEGGIASRSCPPSYSPGSLTSSNGRCWLVLRCSGGPSAVTLLLMEGSRIRDAWLRDLAAWAGGIQIRKADRPPSMAFRSGSGRGSDTE